MKTVSRVRSANCDWRRRTVAAGIILLAAVPYSVFSQGEFPDENTSRLPIGEIVWLAGKSLSFESPAIRIGDSTFFTCVRPPDAPRAKPEELRYQGREFAVNLLATDSKTGLCLLEPAIANGAQEIVHPVTSISVDQISWPAPASPILAIDLKSGGELEGRIAGRDLIYQGQELPATLLRINFDRKAAIALAFPLIDESRGNLIGFLIPGPLDNPGEYHAVPAIFVAKLLRDYQNLEASARGKLGASFDVGSTTPQIVSVRLDSPADRAGLRRGDVILRIADWKIRRLSDVIESLRTLTPEVPAEVEVLRGLRTTTVEVVPETAGGK